MHKFFVALIAPLILWSAHGIAQEDSEKPNRKGNVEDFFKKPLLGKLQLSPKGTYIAFERHGAVHVRHFLSGNEYVIDELPTESIRRLQWSSDEVLLVEKQNYSDGFRHLRAYKLGLSSEDDISIVKKSHIYKHGYVLNALPQNGNIVLYAKFDWKDGVRFTDVYKIDVFDVNTQNMRKMGRANTNSGKISYWVTAYTGRLIGGVSYDSGIPSLWLKNPKGSRYKKVWTGSDRASFEPFGISKDRKDMWVITDAFGDKKSAVKFNLDSLTVSEVLFEDPRYDARGFFFNERTESPIAVTYYKEGIVEYKFISMPHQERFERIKAHLDDESIYISNLANSDKIQIVSSDITSGNGKVYACQDSEEIVCKEMGDMYPWIKDDMIAKTHTITTSSVDGFEIESFLTLPVNNESKTPLIVMPHGGPIGVRDNSHFSGDVQYLAYNGFAVLQVNYRGSSGYGKAFEASGLQEWGKGIEDDIEGAMNATLSNYTGEIDAERICFMGGSYGGYSALMSAIRIPEKVDCVVSFAGVTDLALLFNKSSVQNNSRITSEIKRITGDPDTHMNELQQVSPVYRYKELKTPVMLIHGTDDETVDVEHSNRLSAMLDHSGLNHEIHIMKKAGHGFKTFKQLNAFYDWVIPFLNEHTTKH